MAYAFLSEPTKRIIDHVHSLGKFYQFHCCGKINRFMPYFYELGTDSTQIQRRVNDLPEYKKLYGGKIGFLTPLEGWVAGKDLSDEELSEIVQNNIEIYAAGGGWLPNVYASNEQQWKIAFALYFRSLDYYENGRKPENKKCSESIPDRSHNKGSII